MENENINLRSEEIQDMITKPPHRLVRWGSTVILIIILTIFIFSFFFHYPDIIEADITITTENPPTWVIARSTGKMKKIYIEDHAFVQKETVLGIIDNPSTIEDVYRLKKILSEFEITDTISTYIFPVQINLGTIQLAYSSFLKALEEFSNFNVLSLLGQKIKSIQGQLVEYDNYISHLKKQISLNEKYVYLTEREHNREQELYKKDLSSLSDFETSEKELISTRQSHEQLLATVANTKLEKAKLHNDLIELKLEQQKEYKQLRTNLLLSYEELNTSIKDWEHIYVLKSPIDGILSYNDVWKENQNLNNGDKVFSVVNGNSGRIIGRIQFSVNGSGKVKVNHRVNVKVNGYPYLDYGSITGYIEKISLLPNDNKYIAVVTLPQNLKTSYNKLIQFKGELVGVAEIVTDNNSLGSRLLSPFKYIYKNYFN